MTIDDAVDLCRELIRRDSQTPADAGCQALIAARLEPLGFRAEWLPSGPVTNLWLRRGLDSPVMAFAGHTDVVPTGPLEAWTHAPFSGHLEDGVLHGRGAADMKSGVAAMVVACERFVRAHPNHPGSIALLITSDEEGPAVEGTRHVVDTLQARGEHIDWCIVGEPSSDQRVGDTLRVGRRGSLSGHLQVQGVQGHVAYPHLADNPVHKVAPALAALSATRWDDGNAHFPATTFQVSNIQAGTGATNVIPAAVELHFNFRFGTASTVAQLRSRVESILDAHQLDYTLEWHCGAEPFLTESVQLIDAVSAAIEAETGIATTQSTAGGTSDGRFIAPTGAQVVEFGVRNATIHQIDEAIACEDITTVTAVYESVLARLLPTSLS
ncbi:MAG: succinyl-diaminopimelate desuccinylase [Pseudomonadota bacterium]